MTYTFFGIQQNAHPLHHRPGELVPTLWEKDNALFVQYFNPKSGVTLKPLGMKTKKLLNTPSHHHLGVYYTNGRGFTEKQKILSLPDGKKKTQNRLNLALQEKVKRKGKNPHRDFRLFHVLGATNARIKQQQNPNTINPEETAYLAFLLPDGRYIVNTENELFNTIKNYLIYNWHNMQDDMRAKIIMQLHSQSSLNVPLHWRVLGLQAEYRKCRKMFAGFRKEESNIANNISSYSKNEFGIPPERKLWLT